MDIFLSLKDDLMREVDVETFRTIQETYSRINQLGGPSTNLENSRTKYIETDILIEETLKLLT